MEETSAAPTVWLTPREAGRLLGVGRDMVKKYPIPYHQAGEKGHRRYDRADVLEYLDKTRRVR